MRRGRGPKPLSTAVQYGLLRKIGFEGCLRRDALDMRQEIQPSPLSDRYILRVRYQFGNLPRVGVDSPELKPREEGSRLPHVYAGRELCLYHPRRGEWHAYDRISDTIVPWAYEWLCFYEVWHSTGIWAGGGEHPPASAGRGQSSRRARRR